VSRENNGEEGKEICFQKPVETCAGELSSLRKLRHNRRGKRLRRSILRGNCSGVVEICVMAGLSKKAVYNHGDLIPQTVVLSERLPQGRKASRKKKVVSEMETNR